MHPSCLLLLLCAACDASRATGGRAFTQWRVRGRSAPLPAACKLRGGGGGGATMPQVVEIEGAGAEPTADEDDGVFFEEFAFRGKELRIKQNTIKGHAHVLWDAARVLAGYLDVCPISWEGKKVLDLGSGVGLTGLCVASAGAIVTMTELPGHTRTLQANCELNMAATPGRWTVRDAVWGVVGEVTAWGQVTDLGYEWDYILGADLIYSDDSTPHLIQTLLHSCRGKTEFIMSFELRRKKDLEFLQGLAQLGFVFRKLAPAELHPHWQAEEIGVFVMHRK